MAAGARRLRYRTGTFSATNAAMAVVFGLLFAGETVYAVATAVQEGNDVWGSVGAVLGTAGVLAMLYWLGVSANGMRAVLVTPGPGGEMSLPGFGLRRGFYRDVVALADVRDVRLAFHPSTRNARWRLEVHGRGRVRPCDSITSGKGARQDVSHTRAQQDVVAIREQVRAAQGR